jgi:hypothetical protein
MQLVFILTKVTNIIELAHAHILRKTMKTSSLSILTRKPVFALQQTTHCSKQAKKTPEQNHIN